EANQRAAGAMKHGGNTPATPAPETADSGEQRPTRRGRKPKEEKKQNDFKTIVVDLLEDTYEACRVYICDRQGWEHESDDYFRA
ncbi:AAA family ATPase, partial [Faecalibacterium duncaniae]|uniref:AAA family ATPase n=1 Tax=Faecalibacterium duncaniae (strain DSM 17677 / JCM 31915 / A2-165) TaxID=411483 RepID=UPI002940AC11